MPSEPVMSALAATPTALYGPIPTWEDVVQQQQQSALHALETTPLSEADASENRSDASSTATDSDTSSRLASDHLTSDRLTDAALANDGYAIQRILDSRVDINSTDSSGETALHAAASVGHNRLVAFLLLRGADPQRKNLYGWTAQDRAMMYNHTATERLLDQDYEHLMHFLFPQHGFNSREQVEEQNRALIAALTRCIELLQRAGELWRSQHPSMRPTVIHPTAPFQAVSYATKLHQWREQQGLLDGQRDPAEEADSDMSPEAQARRAQQCDLVVVLQAAIRAHFAKVLMRRKIYAVETIQHAYRAYKDRVRSKFFLTAGMAKKEDTTLKSVMQAFALPIALGEPNDNELECAVPGLPSDRPWYVAVSGVKQTPRVILRAQRGVARLGPGTQGGRRRFLHHDAQDHDAWKGQRRTDDGLFVHIEDNSWLPTPEPVRSQRFLEEQALRAAAANADHVTLEAEVKKGVDVNSTNTWGNTALHWAATHGNEHAVVYLLAHGADPTVRNQFDRTAEDEAAEERQKQVLIGRKQHQKHWHAKSHSSLRRTAREEEEAVEDWE